jgi:beta-mannosidase
LNNLDLYTLNEMAYSFQLLENWQVCSLPLNANWTVDSLSFDEALSVPDSTHIQLALYPDQPYWGDHLRAINEQAWFYRRTFTLQDVPHERARLRFDGVDHFAEVWLNGHYLGQHEGQFAPFEFDITQAVRAENVLIVRVTSPWDQPNPQGSYPADHVIRGLVKGLYEHGEGVIPPNVNPLGIWRSVHLLLDQGISLDNVRVRTGLDGKTDFRLNITNASREKWSGKLILNVTAENHDGAGVVKTTTVDLLPGANRIEHIMQIPDPRLWWPWDQGLPNLYRVTVSLHDSSGSICSRHSETFGIRTVVLERTPKRFTYYINGRPVFLRGSAYIPGLYLSQCNTETFVRDLDLARQANLNLLRVHTLVAPPELYDLYDRQGILLWQDFELNWIQDFSSAFEARARILQHEMIKLLGNHPSIITWACHNEPTMIFARRDNLESHPDPALYRDAIEEDPTRPVFICSGQMESDWERAGDSHTYYGALWSANYTDVYRHHFRLNTEFGFEAPAALVTLKIYAECWERLKHLENQIEDLWAYQAELIQFHTEHLRRLRAQGCAGYIHFWLADLVPQVGCGVLDANRLPKGGYAALQRASQPLHIALEHDGRRPHALWIFNDTQQTYPDVMVCWQINDASGHCVLEGQIPFNIAANASQQVMILTWSFPREAYADIQLTLRQQDGTIVAFNRYRHPFQPIPRPRGYPWKFDPVLGVKVFNRADAASLANQSSNPVIRSIPLGLREKLAEWMLRQQFSPRLLSLVARIAARFLNSGKTTLF